MELLDDEGQKIECIKTSYSDVKSKIYQTIICPQNINCVWKENVHIELSENWKNQHLKFTIYKHNSPNKKPFGFAFLKLQEKDTEVFVADSAINLNFFQFQNNKASSFS